MLQFYPIPPHWWLLNGKLGFPPCSEALIRMKTIVGVHVLTGSGAIATHMTYLTSRSISLYIYGEDSCEKVSFWSNNHSYPNQTRNSTQAADDPKVPFHLNSPRDLDLARGFESELFTILVLARKQFSQLSDLHASTSICQRTTRLSLKKFLHDKLVFHLEILQNIILKVFPYLDDGFVNDLLRSCPRVSVIW
jgi:hypothetical protein